MSNRKIQRIFQAFKAELDASPQPLKNRKAIYCLQNCRTEKMGTSYYRCDQNHDAIQHHHSCRHRSCYLCAQKKRVEWIESQKARLFNTAHFHVVFTLPHEYLSLWRYNESRMTQILFAASQKTLLELMGSKRHWNVTPGILMTLHTWGRQLGLHPHAHCLVTAGGLDPAGHWVALGDYLLPGRVLLPVYRGKVQALIGEAYDNGELVLPEGMTPEDFWQVYRSLYKKDWNVRVQERYAHAKGVALYLARYCKGGPMNPDQIVRSDSHSIEMRYLDHRDKRLKSQRLTPMEFMEKLLQHVPPGGAHTVRYYGLYAPAAKVKHEVVAKQFGCLAGLSALPRVGLGSMLLYCKHCGGPARLRYQRWHTPEKGISINKEAPAHRAGGYAQQFDQPDKTRAGLLNTS